MWMCKDAIIVRRTIWDGLEHINFSCLDSNWRMSLLDEKSANCFTKIHELNGALNGSLPLIQIKLQISAHDPLIWLTITVFLGRRFVGWQL